MEKMESQDDSLKRTLSLSSLDGDLITEEKCGRLSKKQKSLLLEFPLNRHGSSVESQYKVLSQDGEEVDQATLEYSLEDFLSEDDLKEESTEDDLSDTDTENQTEDKDDDKDDNSALSDEKGPESRIPQRNNEGSQTSAGTSTKINGMSTDEGNTPKLGKIDSVYKDAQQINKIIPTKDVETIYEKLVNNRSNPNRMDIVTATILDEPDNTNSDDFSKDVTKIMEILKEKTKQIISESYVFSLLKLNEKHTNRVEMVVRQIIVTFPEDDVDGKSQSFSLKKIMSDSDDPLVKNDPVFQDMRVISKMFPEVDRNEIYAYVEAHHDKKNRIQVVIEELLKTGNSQETVEDISNKPSALTNGPLTNRSKGEFENLCEIFPDCDPNYIFEQLEMSAKDEDRMNKIAAQMFETRNYPKLAEVLDAQKTFSKRNLQNKLMEYNLNDLLAKFPDPPATFNNNEKVMSASYKEHVLIQLKNEFPQFKDGYIKQILEFNNHHLTSSYRTLQDDYLLLTGNNRRSKKLRLHPRVTTIPYPQDPDDYFFKELQYVHHEEEIKDYLKKQEEERKEKVDLARRNGELYECGCCFDDEVLFEDMATCADGHLFCKECVQRSTEAVIGQAKTKFPCLTGTCEHDIPLSVLQSVVSANLFSNLLRKLQEEELRQADIPDLVSCPYCSFATIMPDQQDKVFKCLNQECLKETCRFCQEPNHIPLRCSEVEKKTETDMRTYIENKISEAMLRTCAHCKKRFFKDFGCNKMTCTCGATMCYVCREPDIDYDHFNQSGGCTHEERAEVLHQKEMEEAAEAAKRQYLLEHPEAAGLDLKHDPQNLLKNIGSLPADNVNDYGEDEEDEDSYDDDDDLY